MADQLPHQPNLASSTPVFRGSATATPASSQIPSGVGVPNPAAAPASAAAFSSQQHIPTPPLRSASAYPTAGSYPNYGVQYTSVGSTLNLGPLGNVQLGEGATHALTAAQKYSEQLDEQLGKWGAPIKPWLPAIGRFLMVATFFEDGVRLTSQWQSQVNYIWKYRGVPKLITVLFLALNVLCMFGGSLAVVAHKQLVYGVGALAFVVISQALVYGLLFNAQFFVRNLSILGGLLMVVSDAFVRDKRALSMPGLPMLEPKDRARYLQLAGRILLMFLYLSYALSDATTWARTFGALLGLSACVCVAIGFKARLSAALLVLMLAWRNFTSNKYWDYEAGHPVRDFLRYEHFQILSIVGGLLLVVNSGPGAISVDEKKKIY
ncbi:uncharacterized protein SAPINGB_P002708 [Magnusiomyces paraingens]|uniref:Surfeit locus protein 4 n=1 Tax=Magnusiomyces paraingens TaxID=2606893 RepID=A0A5E8BL34_9ASCO|nr:uncharacterized protein SAPINGB_P002708 [Saprochaete ingens]VVT50328.1 unnamed protein product [Saprochaete ingens]